MTANTVPVEAQWALHGKKADNEGYRVLACSNGHLSMENFTEALNRFRIGAVDTLPQVSVSYARQGTQPGVNYLALAIHWFAEDGQRLADGVRQFDVHGRATAFTSYFCAPYRPLAKGAITYQNMYEAFSGLMLPVENGSPMEVALEAPVQQTPAIDDLAMRVAALLLTGKPVCVLGAEFTRMEDRLEFINTVMALLPYGFRTRMTAATWTRATYREHRFRLFFSSAPRAGDQADHVVYWADPDIGRNLDGPAGEYFDWLVNKVSPLARLPELTAEIGFGPKAGIQALEMVDGARHRPRPLAARLLDRRVPPSQGQSQGQSQGRRRDRRESR